MIAAHRRAIAPLLVAAGVLAAGLTGCGGASDRSTTAVSAPDPTIASDGAATTTTTPATTVPASTSTLPPDAPPSTKPLTTAPPSPLLDEVVAAYDAAYADVLAALSVADESHPALGNHIAGGQLDRWIEVIRAARMSGVRTRVPDPSAAWRRVEAMEVRGVDEVQLTICRFEAREDFTPDGNVVGRSDRPFRYLETLARIGGMWKWTAREWIDGASDSSDCALQ